ncbi:MAG: GYD domain-containing protein [Candidatus Bathyarchaeia archaeon]
MAKFRKKPTKELIAESDKLFAKATGEGAKFLGVYWTLGRFDAVVISEAPDEKTMMKAALRWGDILSSETLLAMPREEALKLLE